MGELVTGFVFILALIIGGCNEKPADIKTPAGRSANDPTPKNSLDDSSLPGEPLENSTTGDATEAPTGTTNPPSQPPIARQPATQVIFKDVVYYDGYAALVDAPTPTGVVRLANYANTRRLGTKELTAIGNDLTVNVTIKAACDNYDRGGHVGLALTAKGAESYDPKETTRIEIGGFITPFMNKNKQPDTVPYSFKVDHIAKILQDADLLSRYDFWVEMSVWGTSSAAVKEVSGCSGRNDVFVGSLSFVSTQPVGLDQGQQFLHSLSYVKALNNYAADATDAIGQTVRTINFDVPSTLESAQFVVITTSHGAAAGGEEYRRRLHRIYLDDKEVYSYTPGGVSCEPFRVYNTMSNGIYGRFPKSWTNSNWCPGQAVPTRFVQLGTITKGVHSFKIAVPDAEFRGKDGNIMVSAFVIGVSR